MKAKRIVEYRCMRCGARWFFAPMPYENFSIPPLLYYRYYARPYACPSCGSTSIVEEVVYVEEGGKAVKKKLGEGIEDNV